MHYRPLAPSILSTKFAFLLGVLAFVIGSSAQAQRSAPAIGAGTVPCGTYIEDRRTNSPALPEYSQWVQGNLTAYNYYSTHPILEDIPRAPTILAYLDKYCREHPLSAVGNATGPLITELGGYRPKPPR